MDTKHTPGPWHIIPKGKPFTGDIANESGEVVAQAYGSSYKEAARLIAAAPDLLKAATAYRNHLKTAAHTDEEVRTYEHLCDVIARATGQQ